MSTISPAPVSVEGQLQRRMQDWKAAFESKDVDGIMRFYVPDESFSAFDLMPPIEFRGGQMWRDNWVSFFAGWQGEPRLEFSDVEVHQSGDIAVVRLFTRLTGTMGGASMDAWVRQTNCFRQTGGEWLMFHDHVSFNTDFTTGQSMTGLSPSQPFGVVAEDGR